MSNPKKSESPSFQSPPVGGGFTMIELLMVMLVITVLLSIGVPAVVKFRTQAKINTCRTTVNMVDKAVSMYHSQFEQYPETITMPLLLSVPRRRQERGTIHGPWNGVDKLKQITEEDDTRSFFMDAFGQSIWYCKFEGSTYLDKEFKDRLDKDQTEDGVTIDDIADYATDKKGRFYRRDYIIMSQSANGKWGKIRGPDKDDSGKNDALRTDDVTNFTRE